MVGKWQFSLLPLSKETVTNSKTIKLIYCGAFLESQITTHLQCSASCNLCSHSVNNMFTEKYYSELTMQSQALHLLQAMAISPHCDLKWTPRSILFFRYTL